METGSGGGVGVGASESVADGEDDGDDGDGEDDGDDEAPVGSARDSGERAEQEARRVANTTTVASRGRDVTGRA
jgi:hypothetical protein